MENWWKTHVTYSIVATPGRLVHHMKEAGLSLKLVEYIVFDEADRCILKIFSIIVEKIIFQP
jgi:ATP-dependent RNA helicase DDX54/DBP10